MLYWETADFIYTEHLCMMSDIRDDQYGQSALGLLVQRSKTVILEIASGR